MKKFFISLLVFMSQVALANIELGKKAPDFKLIGDDNKFHRLSDFQGKFIVLEWYNKDCPFVRKHYESKNMQKLQSKYTAKDVIWLSIISSAPGKQGYQKPSEAALTKVTEGASPTHVLLDPTGDVGRKYQAKTTPHMFIINPKGLVSYMGAIDDRASFEVADVLSAKNYVDEALTALLAGRKVKVASSRAYGCSVKY